MRYRITIPARINILGNPTDANEGDFATISAAINIYAGAYIENNSDNISFSSLPCKAEFNNLCELSPIITESYPNNHIPLPYTGNLDLLKAAINRLFQYSEEFRQKILSGGFHLYTWSEVPQQSGLGGSSLFVILALAGMRTIYQLNTRTHNDYFLAETAQRVESKELGITCGFADRYVPLFGGIAYLDYRGKLYHHGIKNEPYTTYERLDPWIEDIPIVAISTGIQHDSGDVHGRMRPVYLEEYKIWENKGGDPPPMVQLMSQAWKCAWQGKIALLEADLVTFGKLMNQNHHLVNEMMHYCGFPDGAGWANNQLIKFALENGALGAKLTGAGSGGSVFALINPGTEDDFINAWLETAKLIGLDAAQVYRPSISKRGLWVEIDG